MSEQSCRNSTHIVDIVGALTRQTAEVGFFAEVSLVEDDSFAAPEDTASEDKVRAWLADGVEADQIGRALSNIGHRSVSGVTR